MALSVQNTNFLAALNRLGIDVKQFPDKTFDGLFDNVPEDTSYFFNWFIENITPDNVLTESEQAIYYQLESSQSLPLEDEMNNILSSYTPSFQELMCLDINYINNLLPLELEDLSKNHKELSRVFSSLEQNCNEIKKKQNILKEEISLRKKRVDFVKNEWCNTNLLFGNKIDEVKEFIMRDPCFSIDLTSFNNLLAVEDGIFSKFKTCKLLENKTYDSSQLASLVELEEDLACVEMSMIISEGLLRKKKFSLNFLKELHQKKSLEESFMKNKILQSDLMDNEGVNTELKVVVKVLENEIFDLLKTLSNYKIDSIKDQYELEKKNLNKSWLEQLRICKNYVESNWKMNLWLLHILLTCIASVEDSLSLKKHLYLKLIEHERNFSNETTCLELKKQRFKEISVQQDQHPLISALKNVMKFEENPQNNEEAFKNMFDLLLNAEDNSNFITHKFRNNLQSAIKIFFDNTLFGPTSQILFAPAELVTKLQYWEESENDLDQMIKRLANKFVDTKALILKSDRKKLQSWIEVLLNLQALSS